jgi:hypothetical protein
MKMNKKMAETLQARGIFLPLGSARAAEQYERPIFTVVEGSILLKNGSEQAKSLKLDQFPDKTGLEAFINHVHFPLDDSRESLLKCLRYATDLQEELMRVGADRKFRILMSLRNDGCVIRFHQVRPNENWIADDLEGYEEEGILLF